MNLNDARELSKIYRRVMNVELNLKERLKFVLTATFPNQMFYKLTPYIKGSLIGRYKKRKGTTERDLLLDLIAAKKSQEEKIDKFLDMAYLADILNALTGYTGLYKDKAFVKNFYKTSVNFNELKKNASALKKLRNTTMHFNIYDYKINKTSFWEALNFWEQLLSCENCFIHSLPQIDPTIGNILNQMKSKYVNFADANDRHLCDIFDDIALINGKSVESLPLLWSIGRQIYNIKKDFHLSE